MQKNIILLIIAFHCLCFNEVHAQLIVPFTQRPSNVSPSQLIYRLRGDFQMVGNTNLTLQNYSDSVSNNSPMRYVDEDNDTSTWNSSMSELLLPVENNANPACTNIVFAGLYWSARAHILDDESPIIFESTNLNGDTRVFDKRQIKLKGPLSNQYTTITANDNDIYFPDMLHGKMYSAYAEITDYVKSQGVGNYWVADLAVNEGQSDPTGLYGGWSMIVIYENSQMNWRDITVFDGHSYVAGSITAEFEIPIDGFQTSLSGPIDMKLGLIAGEGDRNITGDFFQIRNHEDTEWITLNHANNQTNNFFNSSVFVGNINRQPNLLNNTGLDVSMFQIPNPDNSVITNNQTSTRFKYGTTQDTFVILNLTMSVNSYVSQVQELATVTEINGSPAPSIDQILLNPNDDITYKINIYNTGNEAINDYNFVVFIPEYTEFITDSLQTEVFFNQTPTPNLISFDASIGTNGGINWDYGQLYLSDNPDDIIATLTFKVKVKNGCFILPNSNCLDEIVLSGKSIGIGEVSLNPIQNNQLVIGFDESNICLINPIYGDLILPINTNITLPACFTSIDICENQIIDLFSLLPNSWLQTGSFIDMNNSGALNGSLFNTTNLLPGVYIVNYDVFNNNCGERFQISINVLVNTLIIESIIQPNCDVQTGSVIINGLPSTGNWTITALPTGQILSGTGTSFIFEGLSVGNYTFIVSTENGCKSLPSENVEINNPPLISDAPIIGNITQPSCLAPFGTVELSDLPANGNWTITVLPSGQMINGSGVSTIINNLNSGNFTFTVTNDDNCTSIESLEITINPIPEISAPIVANIIHPTCSLNTGTIYLDGLPVLGNWVLTVNPIGMVIQGNGNTTQIDNLLTGIYTFTVTDQDGCVSDLSLNATINPQPPTPDAAIISLTEPDCKETSKAFIQNFDSNYTYIFNPSGPNVDNNGQILNSNINTNYEITVSNGLCFSKVSLPLMILPQVDLLPLEFYNYLSPNNDGKNDSFNIKNYDDYCYLRNTLQIYNRWGALVFEKENYLHDDIRFVGFANSKNVINKNENLPEGTYFYIFRYQKLSEEWFEKNDWIYLNKP